MSKLGNAIYEINHLDTIAMRDQWVNQIHPLVKLLITIYYIAVVVSFDKYNITGLASMIIYPIAVFILADLSIKDSLKKLWIVLPVVCLIGIWNPLFDKTPFIIGSFTIRAGIISMLTLILKGIFTVLASYLLIATTTIEKICYALRQIHIPKIIVTQIMLTYRYITLLLGEVQRITQAYSLRAPNQKGVHWKVWGSLTGQLLLRSMDRAEMVYESMMLRGYRGEFDYLKHQIHFRTGDMIYLLICILLIGVFRWIPVFIIIGNLAGGIF
jgi:cobalt/nickel transport system permease protein